MPGPPLPVVRVKLGVQFTVIAPAGFAILAALHTVARMLLVDITITSACDGAHSGADDPHRRGEAYDIRTQGLPDGVKMALLRNLMRLLADDGEPAPLPVAGVPMSLATERFFGFIEDAKTVNEHLHIQRRRGTSYP